MDDQKPSRWFLRFYWGFGVSLVALLGVMVIFSLTKPDVGPDLGVPLLVISVLIPFHLSIQEHQKNLIFFDIVFGILVLVLIIGVVYITVAIGVSVDDPECPSVFDLVSNCVTTSGSCPNNATSSFESLCLQVQQLLCTDQHKCQNLLQKLGSVCQYSLSFNSC